MIYVERNRVPKPAHLASSEAGKAQQRLTEYFALSKKRRAQQRFEFEESVWLHADVTEALKQLFAGKCAYCETRLIGDHSVVVDHFRPRTDAQGLNRLSMPDHYSWLAYIWENLYPACRICHLNKGVQFPVVGRRAPVDTVWEGLMQDEKALLLDPCLDPIEKHLVFGDDGMVAATRRRSREDQRGRATIEILGLNRRDLVCERRTLAQRVKKLMGTAHAARKGLDARMDALGELMLMTEQQQPHAGAVRQVLERRLRATGRRPRKAPVRVALEEIEAVVRETRRVQPGVRTFRSRLASTSQTAYLKWAEIRNFRAIRGDLSLSFTFPEDGGAGWKVLLGENGTGKSSVLQAIGLALIGQDGINELRLDPAKLIHRSARKGWVKVGLTTGSKPLVLHFDRRRIEAEAGAEKLEGLLIRGYGATRLLPSPESVGVPAAGIPHPIRNLFNPHAPLGDAAIWLARLKSGGFNRAALALKDLLDLGDRAVLRRQRGRVKVRNQATRMQVELDQLSDGYQSVLALAADLMAGAPKGLHDLQNTPGIVLLDEIGAHLHPRWRMKIVGSLRRAFPKIQFLATTHEPLCLRGLKHGEIEVMRRGRDDQIWTETDLPSPEGLRVDQLLTSHLFGLHTTIDEAIDRKFQRYYTLLAMPELGPDDEKECRQLKSELLSYGVLGYTRRDQLIYKAIDDFLAREDDFLARKSELTREGHQQKWEETSKKVQEIWSWIDYREAGSG